LSDGLKEFGFQRCCYKYKRWWILFGN